jgi:hypothetical protein
MKPTQTGSEIAAALIAVAANKGATGDVDAYLSIYFDALSKIMSSAEDERWPHVASFSAKRK